MTIDWCAVEKSLADSIRRNQHATSQAVPQLAQVVLALPEAKRRARKQRWRFLNSWVVMLGHAGFDG